MPLKKGKSKKTVSTILVDMLRAYEKMTEREFYYLTLAEMLRAHEKNCKANIRKYTDRLKCADCKCSDCCTAHAQRIADYSSKKSG